MTSYVAFVLIVALGTFVATRARRRTRTDARAHTMHRAHMARKLEDRRRSGETDYWVGGLF